MQSTSSYLKKSLATNIPMLLVLKKRGGSYPKKDFETKQEVPGQFEHLYIFTDESGNEYKHYASDMEQETLSLFKPGDKLQVVRKEVQGAKGTFKTMVWTPPEGAEARAAATPQVRSNTAEATFQKRQEQNKTQHDVKGIQIGLQGFMQAHIIAGMSNEEALEHAKEAYQLVRSAAVAIASSPTAKFEEPDVNPADLPF